MAVILFGYLKNDAIILSPSLYSSYIIISPTTFRPGLPLNISVNILKASGPTVVTGELLQNQTSIIAASGTFSQGIQ